MRHPAVATDRDGGWGLHLTKARLSSLDRPDQQSGDAEGRVEGWSVAFRYRNAGATTAVSCRCQVEPSACVVVVIYRLRHNSEIERFQIDWAFLVSLPGEVCWGFGCFTSFGSFGTGPSISRFSKSSQACTPGVRVFPPISGPYWRTCLR